MAVRVAWCGLALVAALMLGVPGAVGRGFATTTTVRIQVEGVGEIQDDAHHLDCGYDGINPHTTCRVSYTGSGSVTFSVVSAGQGWQFAAWEGDDCDGD